MDRKTSFLVCSLDSTHLFRDLSELLPTPQNGLFCRGYLKNLTAKDVLLETLIMWWGFFWSAAHQVTKNLMQMGTCESTLPSESYYGIRCCAAELISCWWGRGWHTCGNSSSIGCCLSIYSSHCSLSILTVVASYPEGLTLPFPQNDFAFLTIYTILAFVVPCATEGKDHLFYLQMDHKLASMCALWTQHTCFRSAAGQVTKNLTQMGTQEATILPYQMLSCKINLLLPLGRSMTHLWQISLYHNVCYESQQQSLHSIQRADPYDQSLIASICQGILPSFKWEFTRDGNLWNAVDVLAPV